MLPERLYYFTFLPQYICIHFSLIPTYNRDCSSFSFSFPSFVAMYMLSRELVRILSITKFKRKLPDCLTKK